MISLPPKGDTNKRANANFIPLKVEAQVAPNMTVQIQPGSFWTSAGVHVEYIGGNSPVLTAPGSAAKWVVIALNDSGLIVVLDGASGVNPSLPSIPEAHLQLSGIFIGDATTQITSDMVFDIRPMWSTRAEVIPDLTGELADRPTTAQFDAALAVKADEIGTDSPNFTLNQNQVGVTSTDSSIIVERGSEPNVSILWNETAVAWQFSNDGTTWGPIGMDPTVFYTQVALDGGALDTLYYTQTALDGGALDALYYTETESDALYATIVHTHVAADVTDFATEAAANSPVQSVAGRTGDVLLLKGDIGDFSDAAYATASQGATADSATQPGDNVSTLTNDALYLVDVTGQSIKSLSDVFTTMVPADGDMLSFDTTNGWQSVALVEADITDLDKYTQAAADTLLLAKADLATPVFTGTVGLPSYTLGSLPAQAVGHAIYVSDATGSALTGSMCFSNGTVWIDVTTGLAVA